MTVGLDSMCHFSRLIGKSNPWGCMWVSSGSSNGEFVQVRVVAGRYVAYDSRDVECPEWEMSVTPHG